MTLLLFPDSQSRVEINLKYVRLETLFKSESFINSEIWKVIHTQLQSAVEAVKWLPGSSKFLLYPEFGKKRGLGSGVKPIKRAFIEKLRDLNWEIEGKVQIAISGRWGKIDGLKRIDQKYFAVEWETGNISSSHRALNKMALGMLTGSLLGGILITPTREMYYYLTDRVGNFEELEPYFPLWRALPLRDGLLGVIAVEHDELSQQSPRIPKGTDGRALS